MRIEKVRLDEVKKAYGDIKALGDTSLSLYQGELLYVTGLSGGGKPALADIISGRMPKDEGRIYMGGRPAVLIPIRRTQTAGIFCARYKTSVTSDISMKEGPCLMQKQDCPPFPVRQGMLHMRETSKPLEVERRLQTPVVSLNLMEHHIVEICRTCCADMRALILDGIARDCILKEAEYMKRLVIRLGERGVSISQVDTRPEIMLDAANYPAVLREGRLVVVSYREEFERQMIDRVIIGENRKTGREITRSQTEPEGRVVLLSAREVRARELRDVSFHVCPGKVVGLIHPEDVYCWEIIYLLNREFKVKSGGAWLAGRQVEPAGGRKNMVRCGFEYIEDYKRSLFPKLDVAGDLTIANLEYLIPGVGVREKLERAVACGYLTLLDIREEDLERPIETLSHRCQLNVALYKWVMAKVRLTVIDSLFSGMGTLMRNSVKEFLEFARNRRISIVYRSPNERELASVCDRLYELTEGKVSCR